MTSNLRRAFNIVLDHNNRGCIVACGRLATHKSQKYAVIELDKQAGFITEVWEDASDVRVSDALRVGDQTVLKIVHNELATWLPDYPDSPDEPVRNRLDKAPPRRLPARQASRPRPQFSPVPLPVVNKVVTKTGQAADNPLTTVTTLGSP